jgi:hypothetical protein
MTSPGILVLCAVIGYHRGRIRVLDRDRLEKRTCLVLLDHAPRLYFAVCRPAIYVIDQTVMIAHINHLARSDPFQ